MDSQDWKAFLCCSQRNLVGPVPQPRQAQAPTEAQATQPENPIPLSEQPLEMGKKRTVNKVVPSMNAPIPSARQRVYIDPHAPRAPTPADPEAPAADPVAPVAPEQPKPVADVLNFLVKHAAEVKKRWI